MNGFLFKPNVRAISFLSIRPRDVQIVSVLDMADQDKHNTFLFLDVDRYRIVLQDSITLTSLNLSLQLVPVELVANQRFFGE